MIEINCKNCNQIFQAENKRFKICAPCKKSKSIQSCRNYKKNNPEKISEYNKIYKSENKKYISDYNSKYNKENREKIQARQTEQHRERRHNDSKYKITIVLRNRFRKFYKYKTNSSKDIVGISCEEYIKWIEFNFKEGMTWENHGILWHIDHLIPCYWFNHMNEIESKLCFNWINTRPLYAKTNLSRKKCTLEELVNQELNLKFFGKEYNLKPLITKFLEKSKDGSSESLRYGKNISGLGQSAGKLLPSQPLEKGEASTTIRIQA
jgi:hypothetical protein